MGWGGQAWPTGPRVRFNVRIARVLQKSFPMRHGQMRGVSEIIQCTPVHITRSFSERLSLGPRKQSVKPEHKAIDQGVIIKRRFPECAVKIINLRTWLSTELPEINDELSLAAGAHGLSGLRPRSELLVIRTRG